MTWSERSLAAFPAGSNGEFNLTPELTMVVQRGQGCHLWDADGREYIDFSMGWGSALVGHANPAVVEAVVKQAPLGSNFSYVNENALLLAEELLRLSPACDRIRFAASGTEATLYCRRLAREFTGRSKILKFEGAYHGATEIGVVSLFPDNPPDWPEPEPTGTGASRSALKDILVAPYNDTETMRRIIEENADDLAGVIVEPLQRCTPPKPGFLEELRRVTLEHGIILIFDEVVTGFRLAYGGAQEYYGVVPDLVAYGKALGGSYPIGAYGGRADVMDLVCESRMNQMPYVWSASTLGGNPISCAAARATLGQFSQEGVYPRLHQLGNYLRDGMRKILDEQGVTSQIIGDGPLAQVVFSGEPVFDYRSTKKGDSAKGRCLMLNLFKRGVFLNPMGTKLYLSIAHDESVCDDFLSRFVDALKETIV
ncbi:MAG: aspartate aminotransferase family protein [Candidatus Hinthialibacter antarcticus]|nr:aspartate aminotransferase family protein [Candidatus Hinthialibacter antarcticus]